MLSNTFSTSKTRSRKHSQGLAAVMGKILQKGKSEMRKT